MRRIILTLISLVLGAYAAMGQYTVEDVTGSVTVKKAGQEQTVAKGMELTPMDELTLGKEACVKIFNKSESKSYVWKQEGRKSVQAIRIDAGKAAKSVGSRVGSMPVNFFRSNGVGEGYVYVESGMVRRSMAEYDPEAKNIEIDPQTMGSFVIRTIKDNHPVGENLPAILTNEPTPEDGIAFTVRNTDKAPIYFNVIKILAEGKVSLSELGQPSGSYVLLPAQTLSPSITLLSEESTC